MLAFLIKLQVNIVVLLFMLKVVPDVWESAKHQCLLRSFIEGVVLGIVLFTFLAFEKVFFTYGDAVTGLLGFMSCWLTEMTNLIFLAFKITVVLIGLLVSSQILTKYKKFSKSSKNKKARSGGKNLF